MKRIGLFIIIIFFGSLLAACSPSNWSGVQKAMYQQTVTYFSPPDYP
jgi:hypothetical protein